MVFLRELTAARLRGQPSLFFDRVVELSRPQATAT